MKTQDGKHELPVCFLDIETNEMAAEVGGWSNIHRMTMGVGVTFNENEPPGQEWRVWQAGNEVALCSYLVEHAKCLVGHNLFRFDLTVLWAALNNLDTIPIPLIDMRDEKPERYRNGWAGIPVIDTLSTLKDATGRFIGLDNLGQSTLKRGKTDGMDGAQAPTMLREGRRAEVIAYCRDDVALVRDIFRYGVEKGVVWYVNLKTRKPRFARPHWNSAFDGLARSRGTKVKRKR